MKNTILVDQDGVLANWQKTFDDRLASLYPHIPLFASENMKSYYIQDHYEKIHSEAIEVVMNSDGFYADLEPVEGAVEAMEAMLDAGYDVAICTSPYLSNASCASDKYNWVIRHLGAHWGKRTILTQDKTRVLGRIIIDDKPSITGELDSVWDFHVVFDTTYNQGVLDRNGSPAPRLHKWADWEKVIIPLME